MGVVALCTAIRTLKAVGMDNIESYERLLTEYTLKRLSDVPHIVLYGDKHSSKNRLGIIPFNIEGIHHSLVAEILSGEAGIAIRNGCFCAQPYIQKLLKIEPKEIDKFVKNPDAPRPGMVRISFGLYNDFSEIDILVNTLRVISENKEYYVKKYERFL
jgi:selenocysteine lyase/cysteine desulfurase